MTNEEAIKTIKCALGHGCKQIGCDGRYSVDCTDNKVITAVKLAISALEKQGKYNWHDLRKNPDDMPIYVGVYMVYCPKARFKYSLCFMAVDGTWFDNYHYDEKRRLKETDVIAWREIDPFEEGEG